MIVTGILAWANRRLWTPADAGVSPVIWLSDDSAITTVSGACSQWNDLSGNGYHFTDLSGATRRPTVQSANLNGRRTLLFDGVENILANSNTGLLGAASSRSHLLDFSVFKSLGGLAIDQVATLIPSGITATFSRLSVLARNSAANKVRTLARALDAESSTVLDDPSTSLNTWGVFSARTDYAMGDFFLYRDGAVVAQNTSSGFTASTTGSTSGVHAWAVGGSFRLSDSSYSNRANMEFAERVSFVSDLSSSDIDRMHGYLAHRWGLQANLPMAHPYKNLPPFV